MERADCIIKLEGFGFVLGKVDNLERMVESCHGVNIIPKCTRWPLLPSSSVV